MRTVIALALLMGAVAAQEGRAPKAPVVLRQLFGAEWGGLAPWQQREIARRYRHFLKLPEPRRGEIVRSGLKAFLIKPSQPFDAQRLPQPLRQALKRVPDDVRPLATKLVILRLRQSRLDRNLAAIPFEQRRPLFDRLFPRRFNRAVAAEARRDLGRQVSAAMVRRLLPLVQAREAELGRALTREEKVGLIHELTQREERKLIAGIREGLLDFRSASPARIRRTLEREGYPLLERIRLRATPRQRELIRYAFRPERCPLLKLDFMGPRPEDPAARRLWERDFRSLARIELLAGDFPPEVVLHLAASHSPADFFRAVKALVSRR